MPDNRVRPIVPDTPAWYEASVGRYVCNGVDAEYRDVVYVYRGADAGKVSSYESLIARFVPAPSPPPAPAPEIVAWASIRDDGLIGMLTTIKESALGQHELGPHWRRVGLMVAPDPEPPTAHGA